ncbi:MAG: cytochrome-c peroxidase, partial [Rhodothermales bacterium]|nr:cytochrome-c peroxidase [Rhodothermales bacterium]
AQGIGEGGWGMGNNGLDRVANPDYDEANIDVQPIRSPSAMNGAYQIVNLWNGQFGATGPNTGTEDRWAEGTPIHTNFLGFEGLETQAIAALTVHRLNNVENSIAATNRKYVAMFEAAFPGQPIDNVTAGLAIGAYERTLLANKSPFQLWLRGQRKAMSAEEKAGAALFFGKAQCSTCHTGPALATMTFYALGMNELGGAGMIGPEGGAALGRGGFSGVADDEYKFKTPQLYNLTDSPFYGHGGTFSSIRDMVEYKNNAVPENAAVPVGQLAAEFVPLNLTDYEIDAITAFLATGLNDGKLKRYEPTRLPSGNCPIANDAQSRIDLGCDLPS